MLAAAAEQIFDNTSLSTGMVHTVQGEACMVTGSLGMIRAQRAAGCLLLPAVGDKVLLALCGRQAFVLNVLMRADNTGARLDLPAGTVIQTQDKAVLTIRAQELHLASPQMTLEGDQITLKAKTCIQRLGTLVTTAITIVSLASRLTTRIARFTGFFDKRVVSVHDGDTLHAGRLRVQADHVYRLRAEHADIRAEREVKIDGERINIG